MKKYKLFITFFLIIINLSFITSNKNHSKIKSLQKTNVLYYSLNEEDNIMIDNEDSIFTMIGKFKIYEEVAKVNWYTYNLFYKKTIIGRYYLDVDFRKRETEICISDKKVKKKFSILKDCINLEEIDSSELYSKIKNSFKDCTKKKLTKADIFNDKGYFLFKYDYYKEALLYFSKAIELNSERVVAYLNIADCYWKLNQKEEAKNAYQKYLSLMQSQNKDLKKVPKRVYERIK